MLTLYDLGWSDAFQAQWDDPDLTPLRIAEVHRTRMLAIGMDGPCDIVAPHQDSAAYAVGDWVLVNHARTVQHRLDRSSVLDRITTGRDGTGGATQLIAANVDTLFIVTSCNADFNVARLERFLALAAGAGCVPVVILTKADGTDDPESFRSQAQDLQRGLQVITLDARDTGIAQDLAVWCRAGQTVALVGSSGVGKSTLTNTLTGDERESGALETGEIREADGKGRHTTRFRALRPMARGGWIIDTPGMRALQLHAPDGIDTVFAEITALIDECKFRDCTHAHEPGCAVQAAIKAGNLLPERLARWRKLKEEDRIATQTKAQAHQRRFNTGGKQKKTAKKR